MALNRNHLPDPVTYFESQGLKLVGPRKSKWMTTACEFHGGSDSMRIKVETGGFVCMAGCGASGGDVLAYHMATHGLTYVDAAKSLGAWEDRGEPVRHQRPKPLPPIHAIQVLALESQVIAIAGLNVANGIALSKSDLDRVLLSANRTQVIAEVYK